MTKIPLLEAKYNAAVTRRPSKATVYVYQNAMAGRYKVTENGWEWVVSRAREDWLKKELLQPRGK